MSLPLALLTFTVAWWIVLFIALPLSIERGQHDSPLDYQAAPTRIKWLKIVVITTVLALLITALLALVIKTGIVPVRDSY